MNASSREVLKEVYFGLFITELNKRGNRVKRNGCPRMKRVPKHNRFSLRFHDTTNRKKERRRKKDKQKSTNTINISKYKELKVCMHENARAFDMQ